MMIDMIMEPDHATHVVTQKPGKIEERHKEGSRLDRRAEDLVFNTRADEQHDEYQSHE